MESVACGKRVDNFNAEGWKMADAFREPRTAASVRHGEPRRRRSTQGPQPTVEIGAPRLLLERLRRKRNMRGGLE